MERKLIRFGKSAFCITLPIEWVRKNSLEKGDTLDVHETLHNSLEVVPSADTSRDEARSIDLDVSGMSEQEVVYLMRAAYINGYFVINLNGTSQELTEVVREHINDFIAAEVMEVEDERVQIHIFWDIKNINLQSIMQRIRFLVKTLFSDTVSLLDSNDNGIDQIREGAESLQRQVLLARRATTYALLNAATAQQFKSSSLELHYISFLTEFLGHIGEYLFAFAQIFMDTELSDDQRNELASLVRSAEHYLRQLLDAQGSSKQMPSVGGALVDFEQAIREFRDTDEGRWAAPVLSEYIRLMLSSIRETEFVMISMQNAPK